MEDRQETFGARLRALREAAGLTQEELGERAGVTAYAISALERGRRTRPYPHTVRALLTALGAGEDERAELLAALPRRAPEPAPQAPVETAGVPVPVTPLVGREQEVAELAALLLRRQRRLFTLVGTGGVGKTRLAAALAQRVAPDFADGTVFVPLAGVTGADRVLPSVARALASPVVEGPECAEQLTEHLRPMRLLLVLDNLEHVLGVGEAVAALVAGCPGLTVLGTSRAPLRVRGEGEWQVQPLSLPDRCEVDPGHVAASAAGALFLERARAVAPSFELTADNAAAVHALCHRLSGIPLALELAAGRLRVLDPQALLDRLDDVMASAGARDLPPRQQTMRAALDWSYQLLGPDEQRLLRTLSVYRGGFTLDAAEHVATRLGTPRGQVLPLLEALVEHSLVVAGPGRLGMLEPVAQYARSLLTPDEETAARDAHAAQLLTFAEQAAPEYLRAEQVVWLARTEQADDDLAAAIAWSLQRGDGETAARIGWALWLYWWLRGRLGSGRSVMEAALQHDLPVLVRAQAQMTSACMGFAQGDLPHAGVSWARATELAREAGHPLTVGQGVAGLGLVALAGGDLDGARRHFLDALPLCDTSVYGDWLSSLVRIWLGTVSLLQGDPAAALDHARLGLASARRRGDRLATYIGLFTVAQVALARGDDAEARGALEEGVRLSEQTGDVANLAYFLEVLAVLEGGHREAHRVAVLLGAAQALRETVGANVYGYYKPDEALRTQTAEGARQALGAEAYDDTVDAGRSLTPEQAVAYALRDGMSPDEALAPGA